MRFRAVLTAFLHVVVLVVATLPSSRTAPTVQVVASPVTRVRTPLYKGRHWWHIQPARSRLPKPLRPRSARRSRARAAYAPGSCRATWFTGSSGKYGPLTGSYAAHPFYPGGTRLRVTRASPPAASVLVVVRDLGPEHGTGACIDLAPSAFRRLAPLGQGVVLVRISRA